MPSLARILLCFALLRCVYLAASSESALGETANDTGSASPDNATELLPNSASKLVRLRREPPLTIVKHIIRVPSKRSKPKPRRRYKRPKIKYSYAPPPPPPSYSYAEPTISSYYKSRPASYSYGGDYAHFNLESPEFELPPHSYEAQSMDLDFYSHSHSPSTAQAPSDAYNFDVEPQYGAEYANTPAVRQPHVSYGVPQDYSYATDFKAGPPSTQHGDDAANALADGGGGSSWQSAPAHTVDDSFRLPYPAVGAGGSHVPATNYGVPTSYAAVPAAPAPADDYSLYEHKIPNSGYGSFGEPPLHHSSSSSSSGGGVDVEITPSFEIKLPPSSTGYDENGDGNKYQATSSSHPGHFAEPPPPPPQLPQPVAHVPHPGSAEDYLPPTQELPLNPDHKPPTYDYPKSSYEVPIYDPIPFEASNNEHHEFYPPHPPYHDHDEGHHEPEESQQDNRFALRPADAATHTQQPSAAEEPSPTEPPAPTATRAHKRKRVRGNNKHILDAPELKEAFEAGHQRVKYADLQPPHDAVVNESHLMVHKLSGDNYANQPWNPMRIRTTAAHTTVTPTQMPSTTTLARRPLRGQMRRQPATATAPTTAQRPAGETAKISILSVEKSRSQSYYDGTVAPPTAHHMQPARPSRYRATANGNASTKRTTKSIFETTYFKAPVNDRAAAASSVTQNVPKNHKPY